MDLIVNERNCEHLQMLDKQVVQMVNKHLGTMTIINYALFPVS